LSENDSINPREWLSKAESLWRPPLESVGLVTEFLNDNRLAQKAAKAFGLISNSTPEAGIQALNRYPAATAIAFTGVAIEVYEGGKFWPGFSEACGYTVMPIDQKSWGDAYLRSLRILGLPSFPDLPKKYLGTILVHAGIPNYCLGDFFTVLEKGMKNVGSDPEAIVQWAVQRQESALQGIDIPVKRFLQYGKEYAVDFVDQALDALISLSHDPDAMPEGQAPERVINAARVFLESNATRATNLRSGITRRKPAIAIRLDPYSGELELLLPALEDVSAHLTWAIDFDGSIERISPLLRVRGNKYTADAESHRINKPTRVISVRNNQNDVEYEFPLLTDKDPIVFFTEEGLVTSRYSSLPGSALWVLFALETTSTKPDFADLIIRKEVPPLGWAGWQLALIDLTDQEKVRLSPRHPFHYVRTQTNARLELTDEITWLSYQGAPVQTSRPIAHLPDNITAEWRVQVLDLKTNQLIINRSEDSRSEVHDSFDPFLGISAPLLGHFEIAIKGPFGRGAKRQICMAEGLTVSESDPWRTLGPRGLRPITLHMQGSGFSIEPELLALEASQISSLIEISKDHTDLTLIAQPPSMAVATITNHVASRWNFGFIRIDSEDVTQVILMLRTNPRTQNPSLRAVCQSGLIQYIDPDSSENLGYASYSLSGLVDSLRDVGSLDLLIYNQNDPIRVARIEPKKIASGAEIKENVFAFLGFGGGDVEVRFWSTFAPWLDAQSQVVDSLGRCEIPQTLIGQGSLLVSWRRVDPWIPHSWPALPNAGEQFLIEMDPDPLKCSEITLALAEQASVDYSANQDEAWKILQMANHQRKEVNWETILTLTKSLREEPVFPLIALANSSIPNESKLPLLIQSGVLWSPIDKNNHNKLSGTYLEQLYNRDPKIASFLIIPNLMSDNLSLDHIDLWRRLQNQHGDPLTEILTRSTDPFQKAGTFAGAAKFDALPFETQEVIIQQSQLLPKSTIDGDSRTQAAWLLFQEKNESELVSVARDGRSRLEFQASIHRDWHWYQAIDVVEARRDPEHKGGWLSLSAQSISFALTAQLAAQGELHAQNHLKTEFRHWLALANYAPNLVYADLVLAQCMAADQFGGVQPINPFNNEIEDEDE
jgi:hypothetical protein